jgi:hypothetical protein
MGVYIKGIKMPEHYTKMDFGYDADGNPQVIVGEEVYDVIPVPPHGRLIDADELVALVYANIALFDSTPGRLGADQKLVREWLRSMADDINEAPTIIEAEGEE